MTKEQLATAQRIAKHSVLTTAQAQDLLEFLKWNETHALILAQKGVTADFLKKVMLDLVPDIHC